MADDHVVSTLSGNGVLEIRLNRPDKHNALNDAMYRTLVDLYRDAAVNDDVRCVLLTSTGRSYCAGNDIGDFESTNDGQQTPVDDPGDLIIYEMVAFEKPVVAAVQGRAIGFGATMLLHCDLVFMSTTATLTTPFIKLALTPEAGSTRLLPERIGHQRAFAMFAFGESLTASEAVDLGLAYRMVEPEELESAAWTAASRLADLSIGSLTRTKRMMRRAETIREQVDLETDLFYECLLAPDAAEAFAAFRDGREPDYRAVGKAAES